MSNDIDNIDYAAPHGPEANPDYHGVIEIDSDKSETAPEVGGSATAEVEAVFQGGPTAEDEMSASKAPSNLGIHKVMRPNDEVESSVMTLAKGEVPLPHVAAGTSTQNAGLPAYTLIDLAGIMDCGLKKNNQSIAYIQQQSRKDIGSIMGKLNMLESMFRAMQNQTQETNDMVKSLFEYSKECQEYDKGPAAPVTNAREDGEIEAESPGDTTPPNTSPNLSSAELVMGIYQNDPAMCTITEGFLGENMTQWAGDLLRQLFSDGLTPEQTAAMHINKTPLRERAQEMMADFREFSNPTVEDNIRVFRAEYMHFLTQAAAKLHYEVDDACYKRRQLNESKVLKLLIGERCVPTIHTVFLLSKSGNVNKNMWPSLPTLSVDYRDFDQAQHYGDKLLVRKPAPKRSLTRSPPYQRGTSRGRSGGRSEAYGMDKRHKTATPPSAPPPPPPATYAAAAAPPTSAAPAPPYPPPSSGAAASNHLPLPHHFCRPPPIQQPTAQQHPPQPEQLPSGITRADLTLANVAGPNGWTRIWSWPIQCAQEDLPTQPEVLPPGVLRRGLRVVGSAAGPTWAW